MNNIFYIDILIAIIFTVAMMTFLSGMYIISSALFASSTITSLVNTNRKIESEVG